MLSPRQNNEIAYTGCILCEINYTYCQHLTRQFSSVLQIKLQMAKGPGARLVPPATLLRKYGIPISSQHLPNHSAQVQTSAVITDHFSSPIFFLAWASLPKPVGCIRLSRIQTLSDSNEACTKLNFGGDIHNTKHIINTIGKIYVNTAVRKTLTRFGQTVQKLPSTDVTRCPDWRHQQIHGSALTNTHTNTVPVCFLLHKITVIWASFTYVHTHAIWRPLHISICHSNAPLILFIQVF